MNSNKNLIKWLGGQKGAPYLFLLPVVILFCIFMLYPIFSSLHLSFQTGLGANAKLTLSNYARMFKDVLVVKALLNTLIIMIIQVPIMLFLSLGLASLLNYPKLWGKGFFRASIYLPAITSLVAYAVLFKILFMEQGLINQALVALHLIDKPILFLRDGFWARFTIITAMTWRWTGYNMILFLAGLQSIPTSIYEAAAIDGSSPLRNFFQITIPMLKPVILFTTILSTIGTLQLFDEPMILTQGGPSDKTLTLGLYLYRTGFGNSEFPYASTLAYLVVILIAGLSFIQFKVAGGSHEN